MKHRLSIVVCLSLISSLSAPDAPRAPRPATDTGSESSTGPVGEAFSAVPANGVTLPNDVNIVHDLQVGNELILTGAHLLLPVAAVAPITALTEGSVADIAGILSMYDATRSSWLSVDRPQVWFTRPGGTIDSYLNVTENIPSKTTGYRMLRDATVTGLTAASGNNVWYVASSGGDFTDLASALASGSVGDGDIISMACETFSTTTEITVSKSVTIQGCSSGTVLQMPSTGTSYNLLSVTANSVTIQNLTLIQQKPHDVADASTVISVANGVTGFHADKLNITTTDWGILMRSAQGIIENSNFYYQGVAGVKHRFLGFYGNTGTTLVRNNTFYPSSDTPVAKTIFCYLTDTSDYAGELIFQNNTQAGTGNLLQFFLQDSFPGIAGGFTLYFAGNSYNDLSGGIIFYGGSDFMDLFASITVVNNTVSNGGGKGLVGFDGYLSGGTPGTTTWYIDGNSIANPSITSPGWAACAPSGIGGYNTDAFASFTITYSSTNIPAPATPPGTFNIEIRKNGCPTALASVPVYGTGGGVTDLNVQLGAGDQLQAYLAGTANNPTVGLTYAYRA